MWMFALEFGYRSSRLAAVSSRHPVSKAVSPTLSEIATASDRGKTIALGEMGRSRSRSKSPSRRRHKSKHSRKRSKSREKHSNNKYSDKPKERSSKSRYVSFATSGSTRPSVVSARCERSRSAVYAAILSHPVRLQRVCGERKINK